MRLLNSVKVTSFNFMFVRFMDTGFSKQNERFAKVELRGLERIKVKIYLNDIS